MQLADYGTMSRLAREFETFLHKALRIDVGGYDFVVPIESKGATLFDSIYAPPPQNPLFKSIIYYPRAFDFVAEEQLRGLRAAAIDDTLLSGRTLRALKRALEARGLLVDTYAFAVDARPARDRDESIVATTPAAVSLSSDAAYKRYLMELRDWYSQTRIPAAYDHLVLRFEHCTRERLHELLRSLSMSCMVLRYGSRGGREAWTAVPYDPLAWLGADANLRASVPAKLRLWYDPAGEVLLPVPMWTPLAPEPTKNAFSDIIVSATSAEMVQSRNQLDSHSLQGRSHLLRVLLNVLPELRTATLDRRHLDRTFTANIASRIELRLFDLLCQQVPALPSSSAHSEVNSVSYWAAARRLVDRVRLAYESQTVPRWQRESLGYTIQDLLDQHISDLFTTHAAIDFLIDGGYLASYHGRTVLEPFTRGVRATETLDAFAVEKLLATYALLTRDARVSSTEAHKLLPMLRHCFNRSFDGVAITPGLGGDTTQLVHGIEDPQDITEILDQSELFSSEKSLGAKYYLYSPTRNLDELLSDPVVEREYGRLRAVASFVHNAPSALTPSQRATLVSTITSERCGLQLLSHDAGAITQAFGIAVAALSAGHLFVPSADISRQLDQMGRAHAEAKAKVALLRSAETALEMRLSAVEPYERILAAAIRIPRRWEQLITLWDWYLDAQYASCKTLLAKHQRSIADAEAVLEVERIWSVGPSLSRPYETSLRAVGHAWRQALSCRGIHDTPADLPTRIEPGARWFAHYDMAGSSRQVSNRDRWFAGSANVIHDWGKMFGCGRSSTRETQAESGFLWSTSFRDVLLAAAWATYALYVLSELEHPEAEWVPIFCICFDDAPNNAVGPKMAGAAKVTKGISRVEAETVAQGIRDYSVNSTLDRLFLLGESTIAEGEGAYPGMLQDRTSHAAKQKLEESLATIDILRVISQFGSTLPDTGVKREFGAAG